MAQRNSPSRRIPDEPLAGIIRNVAFQARYSNRRRSDVETITSATGKTASAEAAAVSATLLQSAAQAATPQSEADAVAEAEVSQPQQSATYVATFSELPLHDAATLMMDDQGRATWQYEDRDALPVVVATVYDAQPALATISDRTVTSATVHVWDLTGQPVAGATVGVSARWP